MNKLYSRYIQYTHCTYSFKKGTFVLECFIYFVVVICEVPL